MSSDGDATVKFYPRSLTGADRGADRGRACSWRRRSTSPCSSANGATCVSNRPCGPSVVRIVDAAERLNARALAGRRRRPAPRSRPPQLFAANPVPPALDRVTEAEVAVGAALRGRRDRARPDRQRHPCDPLRRPPPDPDGPGRSDRLLRRGGELQVAVELPGRGWLTVRSGWGRDGWGLIWRLLGQTLILYGVILHSRALDRPPDRAAAARADRMRRSNSDAATTIRSSPKAAPTMSRALIAAFNALQPRVHGMLDEKDRMLGAIGHDLRTPLAALRVRIESVEDDTDRARMADTIDEMSRTLDDILSLARLGRPSEPPTEVDLAALVDAVVEDFRELGAPVTLADAPRIVLRLRPALMRRAVRNLIENAVKYGGGAEVSVIDAAERDRASASPTRGPGIPPEQHRRSVRTVHPAGTVAQPRYRRHRAGPGARPRHRPRSRRRSRPVQPRRRRPAGRDRPAEKSEVVRAVGIEPTLLAEPDFESGASTNSTTPARPPR